MGVTLLNGDEGSGLSTCQVIAFIALAYIYIDIYLVYNIYVCECRSTVVNDMRAGRVSASASQGSGLTIPPLFFHRRDLVPQHVN